MSAVLSAAADNAFVVMNAWVNEDDWWGDIIWLAPLTNIVEYRHAYPARLYDCPTVAYISHYSHWTTSATDNLAPLMPHMSFLFLCQLTVFQAAVNPAANPAIVCL